MPWITYIYALSNPVSGQVRYVGKTINPKKRLREHIVGGFEKNSHKSSWVKSLFEKGLSPKMEILEEISCQDDSEWQETEVFWINYFRFLGFNLSNLESGGRAGKRLSDETKKILSDQRKGKSFSEEHKRKLCEKRRLRIQLPETGRKISASMIGRPKTKEHGLAISAAKKGVPVPDERRERIRNTLFVRNGDKVLISMSLVA